MGDMPISWAPCVLDSRDQSSSDKDSHLKSEGSPEEDLQANYQSPGEFDDDLIVLMEREAQRARMVSPPS